jgi:hypothetical protein
VNPRAERRDERRSLRRVLPKQSAKDLVRLRVFLEHARRQVGDQSEPGRHGALVALDGVCEFAMSVASHEVRVTPRRQADFHATIEALAVKLPRWGMEGRRAVLAMHTARNAAQHQGVLPDPSLIDDWAEATEAFVTSLIDVAFVVDLREVLLAEAVQDPQLKALIREAEVALNGQDAGGAFDCAGRAFSVARRRWHEQQQDAYGYMPTQIPFDDDPRWMEPGARGADYADVGVFASDLGEYHWLLATRRQVAQGLPAELDDARRALLFVYDWILRWEPFDARYPRNRWRQYWQDVRPPRVGDQTTPTIVSHDPLGRRQLGADAWNEILVQIANIPGDGRGDWGIDMAAALRDACQQLGYDRVPVQPGAQQPTGHWTFFFRADVSGQAAAQILRRAIAIATDRHQARQRDESQRATLAQESAAPFTQLLQEAAPELFGAAEVSFQLRSDGEWRVVAVQFEGSLDELAQVAQIFRSQASELASASWEDGRLTFDWFELSGEPRRRLLDATARASEQVAHLRASAAQAQSARLRFGADFGAALDDPEGPPPHGY